MLVLNAATACIEATCPSSDLAAAKALQKLECSLVVDSLLAAWHLDAGDCSSIPHRHVLPHHSSIASNIWVVTVLQAMPILHTDAGNTPWPDVPGALLWRTSLDIEEPYLSLRSLLRDIPAGYYPALLRNLRPKPTLQPHIAIVPNGSSGCNETAYESEETTKSPKEIKVNTEPRGPFAPFNKPTADLALRSSDKVDFFVHKTVLSLASSFFEDVFSLDKVTPANATDPPTERQVVDMEEDGETIEALLRLIYPFDDPVLKDLSKIVPVLAAAVKYQATEATKLLTDMVQEHVSSVPLEVFAIACRFNLEKLARTAAQERKHQIGMDSFDGGLSARYTGPSAANFVPDFEYITAGAYYRLLGYLRTGTLPSRFCRPEAGSVKRVPVNWKDEPPFNRKDADIIVRSADDVDFRVHQSIISLNGGDRLLNRAVHVETLDDLRILLVDISGDVLGVLLQLCYPAGSVHPKKTISHLRLYSAVVRIAIKYHMDEVVKAARFNVAQYGISQGPLTSYLIAKQFQWQDEAVQAASYLAEKMESLDDAYTPELENIRCGAYKALLEYHHQQRLYSPREVDSTVTRRQSRILGVVQLRQDFFVAITRSR
ncbi:hypothetical protein NM688_g4885 [Phlebia brevispora]|uniref:Uncharacterized protein n=1 Tax=Phlebia brevispora TaxID=194682 RepID=A0ACC1T1U9_9APHY|nr:hypothetical protein NM688_g4885 [Phlebia brevispora]